MINYVNRFTIVTPLASARQRSSGVVTCVASSLSLSATGDAARSLPGLTITKRCALVHSFIGGCNSVSANRTGRGRGGHFRLRSGLMSRVCRCLRIRYSCTAVRAVVTWPYSYRQTISNSALLRPVHIRRCALPVPNCPHLPPVRGSVRSLSPRSSRSACQSVQAHPSLRRPACA